MTNKLNENSDFLLDAQNNLVIQNGDFVIGESDAQHIKLILFTVAGEWKQSPQVGLNMGVYVNAPDKNELIWQRFRQNVQEQLRNDGYTNIEINDQDKENIKIKATTNGSQNTTANF
jgi:hypothetical protein